MFLALAAFQDTFPACATPADRLQIPPLWLRHLQMIDNFRLNDLGHLALLKLEIFTPQPADRGSAVSMRSKKDRRAAVASSTRPLRSSGLNIVVVILLFLLLCVQTGWQTMGSSPDRNRSPRPKGRPGSEPWCTGPDLLRGYNLGYVDMCCVHTWVTLL